MTEIERLQKRCLRRLNMLYEELIAAQDRWDRAVLEYNAIRPLTSLARRISDPPPAEPVYTRPESA
jgi:hypothetical protein